MARIFSQKDCSKASLQFCKQEINKTGNFYPNKRVPKECLWVGNCDWEEKGLEISIPEQCKPVHDASFGRTDDESAAFVASLRVCAKCRDLQQGVKIHHLVSGKGLLEHCSDALITMYSKCGELEKAKELLDRHKSSDVFSWTDLISGYTANGQGHDALNCFKQMQCEGLTPDIVTYISVLKACGSISAIKKGQEIHDEIVRQGLLVNNPVLGNALLDMYVKCNALKKAQRELQELPIRNVVSWSTVIAGYAHQGEGETALTLFDCMQGEGHSPNAVTFVCALKACGCLQAIDRGKRLHAIICSQGLLGDYVDLGNALVDMYAKCGDLGRAQEVLRDLPVKDVVSWNSLISGFIDQGKAEQAMSCFEQMQREDISPDEVSFLCLLRACGSKRALAQGTQIHDEILRLGMLGKNIALGNALVDMYAKCGAFTQAQQALEELPSRNIVSWNTLITEYAQQGLAKKAFRCFELMKCEGFSPNVVSFLSVLKACGSIRAADRGQQLHSEINRTGLLPECIILGNALVDMYAKCGVFMKAQHLLDEVCACDVVSWNALIAGYAHHGQCEQAFFVFEQMKRKGVSPNKVTFLNVLKVCGAIKKADKGELVHEELLRTGFSQDDDVLGTALVDMYAKCGAFTRAKEVLEVPCNDNIFSWNALISGYIQQGKFEKALSHFDFLQAKGLSADSVTFLCILKACGSLRRAGKGEQIHNEISNQGLLDNNIMLGNALVDMYAKCGALEKAWKVLQELPVRDSVSWSTLIVGYVDHDKGEQALDCFEQMIREGFLPNVVSLLYALKACGGLKMTKIGEEFHTEIARMGLLERDIVFANALVDMYAKCGAFTKAWQVFEELPYHNVVSWNALIAGYVQHNEPEQAMRCFEQMQSEGLSPDSVTFLCALKVSTILGDLDKGEAVHDDIVKQGLMENNILLGNAIIDMYSKCGATLKAKQVFEELPSRDVVSWSALIGGFVQQGEGEQALNCFEKMQLEEQYPNLVTFISILKACGIVGATEKGEQIYTEIARQGFLGNDMIGSALVDMYVKCGDFLKAESVISEVSIQNVASWNALIAGYADGGDVEQALSCFESMQKKGFSPDATTFSCILKACGSNGLAHYAQMYLMRMNATYGIPPDLQHYTCMFDVLARAGHFDKAIVMIQNIPIIDHPDGLWPTLLGACQKWGDIAVANWAFKNTLADDGSRILTAESLTDRFVLR